MGAGEGASAKALAAALRARFGDLREGDKLPTEVQLAEEYHVGPQTVQRALKLLDDVFEGVRAGAAGGWFRKPAPPPPGVFAEEVWLTVGRLLEVGETLPRTGDLSAWTGRSRDAVERA